MKNLIEKLKNLDYKQAAIDHAEKAVFGLACLFVLICLAGTSWSRYEKQPEEFLKKVDNETKNLANSVWPQEKRAEYNAAENIGDSVDLLMTKVDVQPYEYRTPFRVPLYPQNEKIKKPDVYPPETLIAKSSEVILHFSGEEPESKANFGVSVAKNDTKPDATNPNLPPDPTRPSGSKGRSPTGPPNASDGGVFEEKDGEMDIDITKGPGDGAMGDFGQDSKEERINAEGRRFNSIVGIVPLRKFALSFSKALNIDSPTVAAEEVEFHEFELERQTASADADPWSGKWEPVSQEVAKEILLTIDDFDPEVVSSALTDPTFTMPLPRRLAGDWDFWATHPRLKALSKEQREEQSRIDRKVLAAAKEKEQEANTKKRTEKGGFSDFNIDIRSARKRIGTQGLQSMANEAQDEMGAEIRIRACSFPRAFQ